jgi:hypothetical protein
MPPSRGGKMRCAMIDSSEPVVGVVFAADVAAVVPPPRNARNFTLSNGDGQQGAQKTL